MFVLFLNVFHLFVHCTPCLRLCYTKSTVLRGGGGGGYSDIFIHT